ncbi:MAG: FIST C-terminal domain-containing protein [Elusimicrobia bacterium]|nr:FIST C-terminal domain-containing protein [Elusimicrobiota bacterium]
MKVGIGVSRLLDEGAAVRDAVRQARRGVKKPDLAFVFGGIRRDQKKVHGAVRRELAGIPLLGGSSYAEITGAGVTKHSVAVLLLGLEGARVSMASYNCKVNPGAAGRSLAASLCGGPGLPDARRLGLLFTAFDTGNEQDMLRSISDCLGPVPLFGGLFCGDYDAGLSSGKARNNWQYDGPKLSRDSSQLALLDLPKDRYDVAFGFSHGWQPVGPVMAVTRSEGNRIFELDGMPVMDVYRQLLGEEGDEKFFELMIQRYGFQTEGAVGAQRLKLPIAFDRKTGSIDVIPVEDVAGTRLRLIQSSRRGTVRGAREAAESCAKALGGKRPDLLLVVSCCSRNLILNSRMESECEAIREVFGAGVPMFGYYSGGELFPMASTWEGAAHGPQAGSRYHVTTIGMLAIAAKGGSRVVQPKRPEARAGKRSGPAITSDETLDTAEAILSNLSRKAVKDAERLKSQTEVIRRYTPHQVFSRVGENAAKGVYELADAEFNGAFIFMDVKGFTAYSENHKPAEVVAAVNRIFDPCVRVIYDCGGDVDKFIGDCVFAAFPTPRSAAEAAKRMSELVAAQRAAGSPFSVRIGVNAGRAVRANVGSAERREYTFIGDAVNLTQRLEANCEPGGVLLSEAVYESAKDLFPAVERRVLTVKNRAEPVVAYQTK